MAALNRQDVLDIFNRGEWREAEPLLFQVAQETKEQKNAEAYMWERRHMEAVVQQGKWAEGESLAQRCAYHWELKFGAHDEDTLDCQYLLCECLHAQKKSSAAEEIIRETTKGMESNQKRGPEHPTALCCKALFSLILQSEGKILESKEVAQSANESLKVATAKVKSLESQGSRRLSTVELLNLQKANDILSKVVNSKAFKDIEQQATIETVSTDVPSEEEHN